MISLLTRGFTFRSAPPEWRLAFLLDDIARMLFGLLVIAAILALVAAHMTGWHLD